MLGPLDRSAFESCDLLNFGSPDRIFKSLGFSESFEIFEFFGIFGNSARAIPVFQKSQIANPSGRASFLTVLPLGLGSESF